MGFSARYHAASLAAVFFALAIGILIGSQIGGDILNSTRDSLEKSLTSDLDESRSQNDQLKGEIASANDFGNSVYPALVGAQIQGERIGLVSFGDLSSDVTSDAEDAIGASGGKLVAVGAVREPPSTEELAGDFEIGQFSRIGLPGPNGVGLDDYGKVVGRQMVVGGRVLDVTGNDLFSQSSGQFGNLDGVIVYRGEAQDLTNDEAEQTADLESGILEGIHLTNAQVVGVEQSTAAASSVGFFIDNNTSSVDNIDQPAGKVSLIYALAGASGNFGISDDSERLLPELLEQAPAPNSSSEGKQSGKKNGKQG